MDQTTTADTPMITLEVHICNQRRSYLAHFATEAQALAYVQARRSTHAIRELDDRPIPEQATTLLDLLYPTCEHGLDGRNCYGSQHWYFDEEEQARGLRNGW